MAVLEMFTRAMTRIPPLFFTAPHAQVPFPTPHHSCSRMEPEPGQREDSSGCPGLTTAGISQERMAQGLPQMASLLAQPTLRWQPGLVAWQMSAVLCVKSCCVSPGVGTVKGAATGSSRLD